MFKAVLFLCLIIRRLDKEKLRAHPYRREDTARYSDSTGGRIQQSPIRSAPIREHRSPSWEKDRRILRDVKGSDRHGVRERVSKY
jgi:hypothetical protein